MMEDLGLGILVSMKDAFSQNAGRVQSSMQSLDATIAASSQRISQNMELIQQGATLMGAGLALMAIPAGFAAATIETQSGLAGLRSEGVKDLDAIAAAAERFTNQWSGASKGEFIGTCYEVKGALANLSDAAVGEFTTAAALTASATKASVAEMVSAFTTGYGIYKPLAKDMTDMAWAQMFSGGMAQTVAAFKTTGAQMAEAIKNIGAMAASANVPLEEQLAILGQLQTTMPGAEAGTLYKAFIQKVGVAGKELGLTFTDAQGHMLGIVPILQTLKQKFPDLASVAAQMQLQKAFGTDEAVKFILQMTAGLDTLQGNINGVKQAMQDGTAVTEQMARAMTSDIGSGLKLVTQQTKNLAEIAGNTMLPIFTPLLQGVQFVVLRLQDWARAHPGLVRGILATSLGLGALLLVVGGVITLIGSLGLLIPAIQIGLATIGPMLLSAMGAVGTTLLPAMLIIAGVIAAVWLLRYAWETNFAGIRDVLTNAWTNIRAVFMGLFQLITSFNGETGTMSASIAAQLERSGLLNFVVTVFQVYARVRSFLEGLWQGFSSFFGNIRAAIEPSVSALVHAFSGLFTALGRVFGIVQSTKVEVAGTTGSWRQFGQAVGEVLGFVGQVVATVFAGVVWVITGVMQVIRGVVTALGWLRETMTVVGNFFVTHWNTIAGVVKWAAIVLGTLFGPALIQTGIQATIAGAQIVGNYLMGLQMAGSISLVRTITQLKSIASMSWGNFTGGIQSMVSALRAAGMATAQYAVAGWRAVTALAAQAGQWMVLRVRTLAGIAATLAARGAQLASSIATGIATAVTWAFNAALWANPITWIVAAILGLIVVVILLWKNWGAVSTWLTGAWQAIKGAAVAVFGWLAGFFRKWGLTILAVVAGLIGWIALAIYKKWDAIKGFLGNVWGWMKRTGAAIWDGVKAGAATISGWCSTAWNGIKAGASQAWEGIKSGVSSYVNFHATNLTLAKNIATGAWDAIANGHGSLWDRCKAASSIAVSEISAKYPWLGNAMQAVGATINGVWQSISGAASSAWTSIKGWAVNAWDGVKNAATGAFQHLVTGFANLLPTALDAGKKLMQSLADGIAQAAMAPFNALKAGLDKLGKLLPHSDAELGPLSMLTQSGFSVLDTMSRGMANASHLPALAMEQAFAFGNNLPSVMPPTLAPVTAGTPAMRPIMPVPIRPMSPSASTPPASEPVRDLLELIAGKLDALSGQTPGDTVVTLDGREIARAVYRDMQGHKIRNYDNR
ncbi:MAG: phage tail tape measure protein [Armatimonadota bacterium]